MAPHKKLAPDLKRRDDETNKTALAEDGAPDPSVHMEAAANALTDAEAGAANSDDKPGITPIKDTPPPPSSKAKAANKDG